ncbi:MAG: hypothetical protein RL091_2929, partial [Verrucomicrobiota bacterium]
SRRFDKRSTLRIIYILAAAGGLMKLVFFNPAHPWLMLFDPILCGPVYVGLTVLVPSMVADLCDADELQSGQRREGLYGAVLSWLRKTGMSLAFLGSGLMLNLVGFDAALKGAQSEGTLLGIRLLVALTTCFTSLIALFALHHYRLNESRAREIRAELESRRGAI